MNYWEKRALEREENNFLQSQEVIEKVKASYYRINQNIKKEIEKIQNKLDSLENATVSDIEAYSFRQNLLKDLEKKIIKEYSKLAKIEIEETEKFYKNIVENTYNDVIKDLRGVNVGISFSMIKTEDIEEILKTKWLGSNYSKRVWNNTTILANELSKVLLDGFISGKNLRQMAEELDRIMKVGAFSSERLIRTEFNYFANQSHKKAYEDYGIEKYQYLAVLDNRTSSLCEELHNKVFNIKEAKVGVNYPPIHPFCRSTTIAYFDDEQLQNLEDDGIIKYTVLNDDKELREFFAEQEEKFLNNLNNNEKDAINYYTDNSGYLINGDLRYKDISSSEHIEKIKNIDIALNKFGYIPPMTTYRCVDDNFTKDLKIGDIYTDKAFMSTSPLKSVAELFAKEQDFNTIFEINIKGNVGAYINELSIFKNEEYELLLKRNLEFIITDIRAEGKYKYIKGVLKNG